MAPLPDPERETLSSALGEIRWTQPEVAWPAALFAGFAGSYAGLSTGVPLAGPFLASALFAPLYVVLVRRGRLRLAGVLAVGWLFAVAAAACGAALEEGFYSIAAATPGAWRFRDGDLAPWLGDLGLEQSEEPTGHALRSALLFAVVVAAARPSVGMGSLLALSAAASAVGAGVGWVAGLDTGQESDLALLVLGAIPPHLAFVATGAALVATALTDPRTLFGRFRQPDPERRQLLVAGGALAVLGVGFEGTLASIWGGWLASSVGG